MIIKLCFLDILLHKQLYSQEAREYIRIDHELLVKLFLTRFSGPLQHWFWYLNSQGKNFPSIFEGLSQRQFGNNKIFLT